MKLMQSVAFYNEEVTGPEHALIVGNRACRMALSERGVAHLTVSKDVQMMKLAADTQSGCAHILFVEPAAADAACRAIGRCRRDFEFGEPCCRLGWPGRVVRARRGHHARRPAGRIGGGSV